MKNTVKKTYMLVSVFVILLFAAAAACIAGYAEAYFTVRVDYRFQDDTSAHDPYVAVLSEGTDIDVTVSNPIIPGYKPVESPEEGAAPALTTHLYYIRLRDILKITVTKPR